MSTELFRPEVLESHSKHAYGDVVLLHPISHFLLAGLGFLMFSGLVLVLMFGHYTRHTKISGVIEPVNGLVKLYASQNGSLKESLVQEGQAVHKGDVLLVFTTEHRGVTGQVVEGQMEARVREKLDTLQIESRGVHTLNASDLAGAKENLAALQSLHENLTAQIANQITRVKAAQGVLARFEELQASGYIPEVQVQDKRNDLTDQQVRLQGMQKDLLANNADIAKTQRDIASVPMHAAINEAQVKRNIAATEAELTENQNNHDWSVIAPCDGIVSSLAINNGQNVGTNTPLLTIVPSDAKLRATLYAPSRSLGFIKTGQTTRIELDAFPYQKFGFATGKVATLSNSPILPSEMSPSTRISAIGDPNEPIYAIRIDLDSQTIDAYGEAQRLRPGMQLSANIELDTRRLYEWVLEPLTSLQHT